MEPYGHLAGENLAHWVTTIATLDLCQRELRHNTLATQRAQSTLFTWGIGDESKGIGNASRMPMWIPTRVDLGLMLGARIGPCHNLQPMHAMAFAMGSHSRLGGYNNPTDTVVGDSNQNKTQRQPDKMPDNREKERGCVYVTMREGSPKFRRLSEEWILIPHIWIICTVLFFRSSVYNIVYMHICIHIYAGIKL